MDAPIKVFSAITGRDYALMPNGDILSVNVTGGRRGPWKIMDVRWPVVTDGKFVGDSIDRAELEHQGYSNIKSGQMIVRPS